MELTINGKCYAVQSAPGSMLLEVLRDELGLTGSKYGCGEGECGAFSRVAGNGKESGK